MRAPARLKDQFIMDMHTHFLRDDTRLDQFLRGRAAVGKMGWNPELVGKEAAQSLDDLKFANYFKEIFLDSDTKVALLTNSPSEIPQDWFLPQDQVFKTRAKVNSGRGLEAHARAFHDHARPARLARGDRPGDRALQARFAGRATPSATTRTRRRATSPTGSTTRS